MRVTPTEWAVDTGLPEACKEKSRELRPETQFWGEGEDPAGDRGEENQGSDMSQSSVKERIPAGGQKGSFQQQS